MPLPPPIPRNEPTRFWPDSPEFRKTHQQFDGHAHLMTRRKSPYQGDTAVCLPICPGCGAKNLATWWECFYCIHQRCEMCGLFSEKERRDSQYAHASVIPEGGPCPPVVYLPVESGPVQAPQLQQEHHEVNEDGQAEGRQQEEDQDLHASNPESGGTNVGEQAYVMGRGHEDDELYAGNDVDDTTQQGFRDRHGVGNDQHQNKRRRHR